jgi:hypothetical protein
MPTPNLFSITTVTPGILASSQLAAGDNAVYTVPASEAAKIGPLILCNVSAAAVVVSASIVPAAGSVDGTHKVISAQSVQPGETITCDEFDGLWLGAGDKISVNAGAAMAIDATVTGLVFA